MQKKSKRTNDIKSLHKNLSIQFSLDGFSFCITDTFSNNIIELTEYKFDVSIPEPEFLLDRVSHIFNENKDLQQDFKSILVIHQNELATVVPNTFFDENQLKSYLNYSIKTLTNDYVVYDDIFSINAKNVYVPFVNINNYLFQNFGEFEFKHYSTILIDKLIDYSRSFTEKHFFVNVSKNYLDIIITKGNQLIFYNSFLYTTKEDFIYYILFVAEQLEMDPDKFQLTFIGAIETELDIYKITYEYVRNINFVEVKSDFFKDSNDFSDHSNYILVS